MGFVITIHVLACVFLIILILIQAGRGGGLVDNLSSMESVLGTKTNAFLTKTTSIMAVLFFLTCLSLAFLSLKHSRSLMKGTKPVKSTAAVAVTTKEAPPTEAPPTEAPPTSQLPAESPKSILQPSGTPQTNTAPQQK